MSRVVAFLIFALVVSPLWAANSAPPSDPQAVAFAAKSVAAMTGGITLNDVVLTGNATRIAGSEHGGNPVSDVTLTGSVTWSGGASQETGTVTLLASGTGESRMSLVLPSGTRTEIRDASSGVAQGQWIAQSGASGLFASQNCATDAVWFFPALGSLTAAPGVVLTYVGQETQNGAAVQHIQSYIYQPNPSGIIPSPQQLSTIDFYLDATTFLPVTIIFNAHPDNNASANLPVEVDFSNYQVLNGVVVPTHIQRSLQGNLLVDITVSGASFNTGLPLSDFTIN